MDSFSQFNATLLYCPKCNVATQCIERLLLVLPDGDLYEYVCSVCLTSVGKKKMKNIQPLQLVI